MDLSTIGWISYFVLWLLVVIQLLLTVSLARLVGRISRRIPPVGAMTVDPGPELGATFEKEWEVNDLDGNPLRPYPRSRDLFLFYVSPHCRVCDRLMPVARRFFREISAHAETLIVMNHGSPQAQRQYLDKYGVLEYRVVEEDQLPAGWYVGGAPYGVWVGSDGRVKCKGLVDRREHLESLRDAAEIGVPTIQSLGEDEENGDSSAEKPPTEDLSEAST